MSFDPGEVAPTIQAFLDGQWVDISEDVQEPLAITRGSSAEGQVANPAKLMMSLADTDANASGVVGTYDPYNANSPYFGLWGENTPVRVYLGTPHLGVDDGFGANSTSHVAPSVTATEAGLLVCMWASGTTTGNYTLPGGMTGLTEQDNSLTSRAAYESVAAGATGTRTATFSVLDVGIGVSVVLHGSSLVVQDAQSDSTASGDLTMTVDVTAGWWLVAIQYVGGDGTENDVPYGDEGGWIALAEGGMHSWVKRVGRTGEQHVIFPATGTNHVAILAVSGDVADWDFRFHGEVSSIRHDWEHENDVHADVIAQGVLRRLQQGSSPLQSALRRAILATEPVAYWPLEDDAGADQSASSSSGQQPMRVAGTVTFAVDSDLPGSGATPDLSGGALFGRVSGGSATSWYVEFWIKCDFTSDAVGRIYTSSPDTSAIWRILFPVDAADDFSVIIGDIEGSADGAVASSAVGAGFDGVWHHIAIAAVQGGSDVDASLYIDGELAGTGGVASSTLGRVTEVWANHQDTANNDVHSFAHIAVSDSGPTLATLATTVAAGSGHTGETAGQRFERLCREEGIAVHIVGDPDDTERMGAQASDTLVNLLRSCETIDMGVMYEPREALALGYRTRQSLYTQAATVTADYCDLSPPIEPVTDDRFRRNDVTVVRRNGSSARAVKEDGPMSVQAPPNGVGRYDTTVTVAAEHDTQLAGLAGWWMRLGTVPERRYPQLVSELAGLSDAAARAFRALDIGDRLAVVDNLPARLQSTGLDQIMLGYTEVLTAPVWDWFANTAPYSPYRVGVFGDDSTVDPDRYTGDGGTLAIAVDADDTSLRVLPGPWRWTTDADDFDPDIRVLIAGETIDLSAIANAATFHSVGSASIVVNAAATPGAPSGVVAGDQLFMFVGCSDTGLTMPSVTGWGQVATLTHGMLYGRVADGTADDTPTVTVSGIGAGDVLIAQIARWSGVLETTGSSDLGAVGTNQGNASAQNIATPGLTVEHDCSVVLALAMKLDDWTSVAGPAAFTEIGEPDHTNGFGLWWGYSIQSDRSSIQPDTITVTGGSAAVSRARVIAVRGLQTMTVSARAVNGVVKSHAVGAEVELAREVVYAL